MTTAHEAGTSALRAGDWEAAREAFERALAESETPEALEGLGQATGRLGLQVLPYAGSPVDALREAKRSRGIVSAAVWAQAVHSG